MVLLNSKRRVDKTLSNYPNPKWVFERFVIAKFFWLNFADFQNHGGQNLKPSFCITLKKNGDHLSGDQLILKAFLSKKIIHWSYYQWFLLPRSQVTLDWDKSEGMLQAFKLPISNTVGSFKMLSRQNLGHFLYSQKIQLQGNAKWNQCASVSEMAIGLPCSW